MGEALSAMKQYRRAIDSYDKALVRIPDNLTFWRKREAALAALQKDGDLKNITSPPQMPLFWRRR